MARSPTWVGAGDAGGLGPPTVFPWGWESAPSLVGGQRGELCVILHNGQGQPEKGMAGHSCEAGSLATLPLSFQPTMPHGYGKLRSSQPGSHGASSHRATEQSESQSRPISENPSPTPRVTHLIYFQVQ